MAPASAFPRGAYGKYKRATAFFLQWLLRARVVGGFGAQETANTASANTKKKKKKAKKPTTDAATSTLDEYARIVAAIAEQPTALPATLRRQWPRAIAACECAITLRAQVAQFFPAAAGDDPHLHFLQRLTEWFQQLCDANVSQQLAPNDQRPTATRADGKALDLSNYYDVLDLPDDFFEQDGSEEIEVPPAAARALSSSDRKRLTEEPFSDDEVLEAAYFLFEMDELSEAVYSAFHEVKLQKKSLIEATVVTLVAVDFAKSVVAEFQLRQPGVRTGKELARRVVQCIPIDTVNLIMGRVHNKWRPSPLNVEYQYVRGAALLDFVWVSTCLDIFAKFLGDRPRGIIPMTEDSFDETYSEEYLQHYTIPGFIPPPSFFMQQLRLLYKASIEYDMREESLDRLDFTGCFFKPLLQFFKTREVSIELMVVCIYWVRSVSALQGGMGLSRAVSVSVLHQWDLEARLRESIARIEEQRSYSKQSETPLDRDLRSVLGDLEFADELTLLARANPIVAGGLLLSNHLSYLHVGTEVSMTTTHLRAFAHLYSALRDRQLLDEIPFFEDFTRFHEIFFFAPSRAASVHGCFLRGYRAKSREYRATPKGQRRHKHLTGLCRCLTSVSMVLRLLDHQSYTELSSDVLAPTASWKARLEHVSELCGIELFGPRILSRDLLKISDDVTDLFIALRDGLGRDAAFVTLVNAIDPQVPAARAANKALEEVIVPPLLLLLDSLNLDGSVTLAVGRGVTVASSELDELVLPFCQRVAGIVAAHFRHTSEPSRLERRYYTLPHTPDWGAIEFGTPTCNCSDEQPSESTRDTFQTLMEMMTESPEALTSEQITRLKNAVKADPTLLSMVVDDPTVELSTLFHHVAAGRARDRRLVEWFIQMGALHRQPQHFQIPAILEEDYSPEQNNYLCNYMAVHSAAKAGLTEIVELILGADLLRDINKVTYHTKESLVHIAVRNNDRVMVGILENHSADCRHKDSSGKYPYDYTNDASWKRELVQTALWQRRADATQKKKKEVAARQREASKSGGEAKPAVRAQVKPPPSGVKAADSKPAEDRCVEKTSTSRSSKGRVEQLAEWMDTLKRTNSSDEAVEVAAAALRIVDTVRASVAYFANLATLYKISREVAYREASDAWQMLLLFNKFYRQLPAATRDLLPDDSAMGKLKRRAGPAKAFDDFMAFAMHTAFLFDATNREPPAQETLELLERRLLKVKPRDKTFCETVKAYLQERRRMKFEPALGSLPEAQRVFQWMEPTTTGIAVVDLLGRFTWFRRLVPLDTVAPDALEQLRDDPTGLCLCVGDVVVVAAHTSQELTSTVNRVVRAARERWGVRFHAQSEEDNVTELVVDGLTIARRVE